MRKLSKLLALGFLGLGLSSCGSIVNPGEQAVIVRLTGSNAGFENAEVVKSGRAFGGVDTQVYFISTKPQEYTWTKDTTEGNPVDESFTFATNEGVRINTDVGISYQIIDAKKFIQFYKVDDDEYQRNGLRTIARDTLNTVGSTYTLNELLNLDNDKKVSGISTLQEKVKEGMNSFLSDKGVQVTRISFVNGLRPPQNIQDALTSAQKSAQDAAKAKQDLEKAKAELAVKKVEAEQAKVEASTITPQLLQKMQLENQKLLYDKWNGQGQPPVPQVVGGSNTSVLVSPSK